MPNKNDAPTDLIMLKEAAEMVGRHPSSITRYIQRYPELNYGVDGAPLVSRAEFAKHHLENYNTTEMEDGEDDEDLKSNGAEKPAISISEEKGRQEYYKAQRLEFKDRQTMGEFTPREEVIAGAENAGNKVRAAFDNRRPDMAERLARMENYLVIEQFLIEADEKVLDELVADFRALASRHDSTASNS